MARSSLGGGEAVAAAEAKHRERRRAITRGRVHCQSSLAQRAAPSSGNARWSTGQPVKSKKTRLRAIDTVGPAKSLQHFFAMQGSNAPSALLLCY